MPDCSDKDRRNVVLTLACVSAIEAADDVLTQAVNAHDVDEIEPLQQLLEYALGFDGDNSQSDATSMEHMTAMQDAYAWKPENLTWTGSGWTKTVENVLAKGMPLQVKAGNCKIEECPSCVFENICSREETQKLIDRSRKVVAELKASMAQADEHKKFKAQLDQLKQTERDNKAADEAYFTERQKRRLASKNPEYVYFS